MNSATDIWPGGLGSSSGELGHNIMDHHYNLGASGIMEGYEDKYYFGRRPNGIYVCALPTCLAISAITCVVLATRVRRSREGWSRDIAELIVGAAFKEALTEPGQWTMGIDGFGELLPYHDNKISLDQNRKDKWGLPILAMDAELKDNEKKMRMIL